MLWPGRGSSRALFGHIICQVCRTAPDWTNSTSLVDFCQDVVALRSGKRTFGSRGATHQAGWTVTPALYSLPKRRLLSYLEGQHKRRDADAGRVNADPGRKPGDARMRAARRPLVAGSQQGDGDWRHLPNHPGYRAGYHRGHKPVQGLATLMIQSARDQEATELHRSVVAPGSLRPRPRGNQRTGPSHQL